MGSQNLAATFVPRSYCQAGDLTGDDDGSHQSRHQRDIAQPGSGFSTCAMVPDYGAPAYPYAYNGYADYPWVFGYGPPFLTRIGGIFATPEVAVVSFGALVSTSD